MPDAEHKPFTGPWVCFHCGERCETREEAEYHFGLDYHDGWKAACVDPLRADERAMREELVDTHKELNAAREGECNLRGQVEGLEYGMALLSQREPELMRRLKGATLSEALNNLEDIEGRLIAAEAYVSELRRRRPALYQLIQDHICRRLDEPTQA